MDAELNQTGRTVDDWHIRIDRRYLDPSAGSGARAKEAELAAGKGGVRRFVEGILDIRSDDRNWRRGAEGEERVAARLHRKLDDGWSVIHDLTIGSRGANLDHLVIGPGGVFALNTKNLKGRITVYDRAVLHNGQNHGFLPKCRHEAERVSRRLSAVAGFEVSVRSVLVLTGPAELRAKGTPANVRIIGHLGLPRWLTERPAVLTAGDVLRIERAARDPETWLGRPSSSGRRRRAGDPAGGGVPTGVTGDSSPQVQVRRWTRYGKDRFYANAADGTRLGYIEVGSGEIVLEVDDGSGVIAARLRASRRSVAP